MSFEISSPLEIEPIQRILKTALDKPYRAPSPFTFNRQESYMGYDDSFQYELEQTGGRGGRRVYSAVGTMNRTGPITTLRVDYFADLGILAYSIQIHRILAALLIATGICVIFFGTAVPAGLAIMLFGLLLSGILFLVRRYHRNELQQMHDRIMRILRKA